ncbi:SDR family oxidoreductase [Cumulibacter manganitolerans]|uniref:SDR family oxidoreductase n=1 Tax=Cumulibacter manganitolerans TaxID=1884992 RepID=UPI0012976A40|nr:SDR family oxidoreductase [Cumulibacter manganitolerans]
MTQRVLVTAGGNGIGLAVTRAFAATGARVHVADIAQDAVARAVEAEGVTGSVTDVADAGSVDALFADLRRELGGLDVLVNNAGIAGPTAPVDELAFADWRAVVDVNLHGTFMVTQRAIPLLKESDAGSIITMSSVAGRFGYPNRIAYSSTKWALVGFAKTLAMELGRFGITSNTIHPGAVAGERIDRVLRGRAEQEGTSLEEQRAAALANQSVKAFTDPADIAALAVFLAGPHGRSISGQALPIDGDSKSTV